MQYHVVVWDPQGEYSEGSIVGSAKLNELHGRGVCTLPCVPEIFQFAGVSGYSRRGWGSGWPLDTIRPGFVCPLTMFAPLHGPRKLHWAARLMPSDVALERIRRNQDPSQGVLRIAAHEQRGSLLRGAVSDDQGRNAVDCGRLGPVDAYGGWTVGGQSTLNCSGEGCYGLSLFGFAPGLRVAWVAATLAT